MGTPILFTNIPAFSGALPSLMMPSVITEFLLTNGLLWENCIPFMREPNLEIKKNQNTCTGVDKKIKSSLPRYESHNNLKDSSEIDQVIHQSYNHTLI